MVALSQCWVCLQGRRSSLSRPQVPMCMHMWLTGRGSLTSVAPTLTPPWVHALGTGKYFLCLHWRPRMLQLSLAMLRIASRAGNSNVGAMG